MQLNELVEKAAGETASVMRGVRPHQLGAPTPCGDWEVEKLANHLLQVVRALRLAGRGEAVPGELWGSDLMSGEWARTFGDDADAATEAWVDPASWAGSRNLAGADLPAYVVATMLAGDLVIHGWDLARATGQSYRCDDAVAEATHGFIVETGDQGRQMKIYGPPVPVPDEASLLDKALALSGRDPHWVPAPASRG